MSAESREAAAVLARNAALLVEQVSELTGEVRQVKAREHRSRMVFQAAMVGLALDLTLSVLVGFILFGQRAVDMQLQAGIEQQDQIRTRVLCPLYAFYINSEGVLDRGTYPQGPEAYDALFVRARAQNEVLGCVAQ